MIYAILGAFARRWYGGALEIYKILKNRGVQTAFMIGLFLTIYLRAYNWIVSTIITSWLQFQFWSRGHGCCFDMGRGNKKEETIKRYQERWYYIPCDWLSEKLGFEKYGIMYDFCYMTLRYTCPMLPMMFLDWRYILIGLSISFIYLICWTFNLKGKKEWLNAPTKIAELISGAVVYYGCYILQ